MCRLYSFGVVHEAASVPLRPSKATTSSVVQHKKTTTTTTTTAATTTTTTKKGLGPKQVSV